MAITRSTLSGGPMEKAGMGNLPSLTAFLKYKILDSSVCFSTLTDVFQECAHTRLTAQAPYGAWILGLLWLGNTVHK